MAQPGSGLMVVGAMIAFAGVCIILVKVFKVPDYAVLVGVGTGLIVLGLVRRMTSKDW